MLVTATNRPLKANQQQRDPLAYLAAVVAAESQESAEQWPQLVSWPQVIRRWVNPESEQLTLALLRRAAWMLTTKCSAHT